jgi:hypothetical protein
VLESTAKVVQSHGIQCEPRGITFVKGKGEVQTYFVSIDDNLQLVPREMALIFDRGYISEGTESEPEIEETSL